MQTVVLAALGALTDISTGQTAARPRLEAQLGHQSYVEAVAISPDNRFVVTGGRDQSVRLWDVATGLQIRSFAGHRGPVSQVAFSPDGKFVITGSWDKTVRLWETATGRELRRFVGHNHSIQALACSADGRRVLTGDRAGAAHLWDTATGKSLLAVPGARDGMLWSVAISPDGRHLLLGDKHGVLRVLDARSGAPVRRLEGHESSVHGISFSRDGHRVLTTSRDRTTRVWGADSGREVLRLEHRDGVGNALFLPDGKQIMTGGRAVRFWDARTGEEIRRFVPPSGWTVDLKLSADGTLLVAGSHEKRAYVCDVSTGKELVRFEGTARPASRVALAPNRRSLVVMGDGRADVWDLARGRLLDHAIARTSIIAAEFSPDGRQLLTGGRNGAARLWNWPSGEEVRQFVGHSSFVNILAFSSDGRRILTGSSDRKDEKLLVWETSTGRELSRLATPFQQAALSPDGRRIATGGGTARIWDAASGRELHRFELGRWESVLALAFSPDARSLLAGTDVSYVPQKEGPLAYLWDTRKGKRLRTLQGDAGAVRAVAFSRDGRTAATGHADGITRLWGTATGRKPRLLKGHGAAVLSVAFSRDGRRIVTAGFDSTARIWDTRTGKELCTLISFKDGGWAVVDSAGRFDASSDGDVAGLHWVRGDKPLPLDRLKEDYYDPGLLAKLGGFVKKRPRKNGR